MLKQTFLNLNNIPGIIDISDEIAASSSGGATLRLYEGKNFSGQSWNATGLPNDRKNGVYLQGNQVNAVTSLKFTGLKKNQIYAVTF